MDPHLGRRADVPPSGRPLGEYLQLTPTDETQCTWCAAIVAPASEDWKRHAVSRRLPGAAAGPHRAAADEFFLVEAICGSCGTLLDTDLVLGDDPPLHDRLTVS